MWSTLRTTRDYNRGLPPPVRWAHLALAAARDVAPLMTDPRFRWWTPPLVLGFLGAIVLRPLDGPVIEMVRSMRFGGDLKRELEALQQYGQLAFSVIIATVIFTLDPANRRRLVDWALAGVVALVASNGLKFLIGRPRPGLNDPLHIVGPVGAYPIERDGIMTLESVWTAGHALSSMPSRHATFAVVSSVFLSALYPRLKPIVFLLALVVCVARILNQAHYPTDVIAGAAIGLVIGRWAVRAGLSSRIGPRGGRPMAAS